MTKFICMVGLPGSGKSTYAAKLAKQYNAVVCSSDDLREKLFGNATNQKHNVDVFEVLHKNIKDALYSGQNVIMDSTNISYKRRMAFLQELKNIPCEKICVLMATPYDQCLKNDTLRDRHVPEYVIERMYRQFDIPWYYEGWDSIWLEYFSDSRNSFGLAQEWTSGVKNYNQDNSHHDLTLGEHCLQAVKHLDEHTPVSDSVRYATMIHDCGKPFCKTFVNGKGKVTEQAHYYSHEHTGSYNSLFYDMLCSKLYVSVLIRWHMQPYFWEKDNNEKLHNKYKRLWGEQLYSDIMKLHEADKNAH